MTRKFILAFVYYDSTMEQVDVVLDEIQTKVETAIRTIMDDPDTKERLRSVDCDYIDVL